MTPLQITTTLKTSGGFRLELRRRRSLAGYLENFELRRRRSLAGYLENFDLGRYVGTL